MDFVLIGLVFAILLCLTILVTIVVMKRRNVNGGIASDALENFKQSQQEMIVVLKENYAKELENLQNNNEKELRNLKENHVNELQNIQSTHQQSINMLTDEKNKLQEENTKLLTENRELTKQLAEARSNYEASLKMRENEQAQYAQGQKQLETHLTNIGERLLKERSEALQQSNTKQMEQTINPLREELNIFRNLISQTQKDSSEQAGSIKEAISSLANSQQLLSNQALELTNALRTNSRSQGVWGEQQLSLLLQQAGLLSNIQFEEQKSVTLEDGHRLRPDFWIRLPGEHGIIIDSKVSLTAFVDLINTDPSDKKKYDQCLKRHIESVRKHIEELAVKDYSSLLELKSPPFVFLFMPMDSALNIATEKSESNLYELARSKNIYLVSPSSLIPALRVVSALWVLSEQNTRIAQLVELSDKIYNKSLRVSECLNLVLKSKDKLNSSLEELNGTLAQGQGNLLRMLERFSKTSNCFSSEEINAIEQDSNQRLAITHNIDVNLANSAMPLGEVNNVKKVAKVNSINTITEVDI